MQKLKPFIPLFILTLFVALIAYSVKTYQSSHNNALVDSSHGQPQGIGQSNESDQGKPSLLARLMGKKAPTPKASDTHTPLPTISVAPLSTKFDNSSVTLSVDEEKTISVLLTEDKDRPTAITFNVTFDPQVIQVIKVEPGDIWTKANILQTKIDNAKGTFSFSAGQGFDAQTTSGTVVMKIVVRAKQSIEKGSLTIENTSKFAYSGVSYAIPLQSGSIVIQTK